MRPPSLRGGAAAAALDRSTRAPDGLKAALRRANVPLVGEEANQQRSRLNQVARPFRDLLTATAAVYRSGDNIATATSTTTANGATAWPPKRVASIKPPISASDLQGAGLGSSATDALSKILHPSMATAGQMRQQLSHVAMSLFARRPNDTGSPEVQAALWSVKISALEAHTRAFRHDYVAERKIVEWRDQRRKILRYLQRLSLERYYTCLDRLGLPHDLVEAAVSRFPLERHHGKRQRGKSQ